MQRSATPLEAQTGSLCYDDDDAFLSEPPEPAVGKNVAGTIGRPAGRIHFAVRAHRHFRTAAFLEILDQFFAGLELRPRGLIAVEIPNETNAEPDVVHVIAVDVAAPQL